MASAIALVGSARPAAAYTIDSPATRACHEQISEAALRTVRKSLPNAGPLPSTGVDDAPLIDDVPFTADDDMKDLGAITFLLGIRDNDLKNVSSTALDSLAQLNSDPGGQREHCLRTDSQKEPTGSKAAVDDCRAFIHDTLLSSLDGLGADGAPDPNKRETLEVSLAVRGDVKVDVPMFWLRAGRAAHAIEDSFTHTFRNKADRHKITVVLNWIDYAESRIDEATDGPPHLFGMDRCDDPDALLTERRVLATEAVSAALKAVLDPALSRDQKEQAIGAVLDGYVVYDATAGCTSDNHWCDAPENSYRPKGCGCAVAGGPSGEGPALGVGLVVALLGLARRRRRARGDRSRAGAALVVVGVALGGALLAPTALSAPAKHVATPASSSSASIAAASASAAEAASVSAAAAVSASGAPVSSASASAISAVVAKPAPTHESSGPLAALEGKSQAAVPGSEDPVGALFGRATGGVSYDKPAFELGLGARYQFAHKWMVGFDGEWNPWLTTVPRRVRSGVLSGYVSIVRRYQMAYEGVNFRSTFSLGGSYLLFNLVGAPKGSVGPFIGLSFLGVEFKLTRGFFLTVDPTTIVFPVPHVTGAPFGYLQYRFQVALEFGG